MASAAFSLSKASDFCACGMQSKVKRSLDQRAAAWGSTSAEVKIRLESVFSHNVKFCHLSIM